MKFEIPSGNEIFRWGPIPLKCTYAGTFFQVFQKTYLEKYGFYWANALLIMHDGKFVFVQDDAELKRTAGGVFVDKVMTSLYDQCKQDTAAAVAAMRANYAEHSPEILSSLAQDTFVDAVTRFNALSVAFEQPTILPEMGNYGSIPILENELLALIVDKEERARAVVALTTSEKPSFFQQEEIELQETDNVEIHQRKYFWLKNSYSHVEVLPLGFFEERKKKLLPNMRARQIERAVEIREHKREIISRYAIPTSVVAVAERIVDAMEFQDERKREMSENHHYKDMFMREFGKRGIVNAERYMLPELVEILTGQRVANRADSFGFVLNEGVLEEFADVQAREYWGKYANEKAKGESEEIGGTVASKGILVRGKVKIVLNPESIGEDEFETGEVLVASMTSPEYVFLMKRAAAIITDTGGLTSHAAIVSREIGVPCIVGTKIATQVLKDGDVVEVDADNGVVRKL